MEIPEDDRYLRKFKQETKEEEEKLLSEDPLKSQDNYNSVKHEDIKMEIVLDTDEQGNEAVDEIGVPKETGTLHIQVNKNIELKARYIKEERISPEETPQSPDQSSDSGYNVPLDNDSLITENVEVKIEVYEDHRQENEVGASGSKKHELQQTSESSKTKEVSTSAKGNIEISNVQKLFKNTNKQDLRNVDSKKKIACDHCDFKTTFKYLMKIHSRTHTGEKPFSCSNCEQRFSYQSNLTTHLRRRPTDLSCEYCEKKFCLNTVLLKHIITEHTGQKRYICGYCDKVFAQKSNLKTHIRTHTGEKPFVCTQCEKQFRQKLGLIKHLKTHTNPPRLKPFTCSYCEKQFTLKKNFIRHLKVLHKEENPHVFCQEN